MKIGPSSSPAADAAALSRANAEAGSAAAKARSQTDPGSSVQLSSAAAGLLSAGATPEFDAAKVERVRQAIAEGRYTVDAEAIADKLIANAQEVLGAARR
jgi:negative regulator of flagellin synthesis FlgM